MRPQFHPKHLASFFSRVFHRFGDLYSAALSTSTGVDLRLHHNSRRAGTQNVHRRRLSFFARRRHHAARHGDAILLKNSFSLILMNFHNDFNVVYWLDSKPEETRLRLWLASRQLLILL